MAELQKNTPAADHAPAKPDVAEKPATTTAEHQPSALHTDTHGTDALDATRQFRLHAEKSGNALPSMDVHQELKRDGSAQEYHVHKGDTLSDIAKRQLPPGASVHDIYSQVKEIAKANHIANPDKIQVGLDLKLPQFHPHAAAHRQPHEAAKGADQPPHGTTPGKDTLAHPGQPNDHTPPAKPGDHTPPAKPGDATPPAKPGDATPPKGPEHQNGNGDNQTPQQKAAATNTAVEALQKALGDDDPPPPPSMGEFPAMPTGPITDKRKIMDVLGDKSPEEIKAITAAFDSKYGKDHGNRGLETVLESRLSGTDKSKVTDIFHRTDKADDAGRVHTAMQEMHQWFGGRSQANCEKDIRDTLATMNSTQLAAFKQDYETRYHTKFDDDISKDSKMSAETKSAIGIYEKGSDHRTTQDTLALADLATKAKSLDMFQEAFRGASNDARTQYMANGGDAKMKAAFSGIFSDSDVDKARDYVKEGHLDTATNVKDNTGIFSSNDKAIDTTINAMSQADRDQYDRGKAIGATFPEYVQHGRSRSFNQDAYNKLTPDQKTDYDKYRTLHDDLTGAGSAAKVARWEDMISNHGETLVTKLAQHGGMWTDKVDKAMSDIEGMNKGDFNRLKTDPNYRKEVDAALALNYSGADLQKAEDLLNTKLKAASFEQGGQDGGNRNVIQEIKDKDGFWNPDTKGMLASVENMSAADQKKYREDPNFKKDVDNQVKASLQYTEQYDTATRALERVSKGLSPQEDVIDKLNSHIDNGGDRKEMIGELETAFKNDPASLKRIQNPVTADDKAFAKDFEDKARQAFGDDDYAKLVEPLVKTGYVPFAEKAEMYKGFWSNDTKGVYDAIAAASPADQQAIAADPAKTLSFLSPDQQALAANIARQGGQMKPEDQMRAAILGESGDKDTIKDLGSLKPEDRAQLVQQYQVKYGSNLMSDLDDKLSGQDRIAAERNFRELPETAREAFNNARTEESVSNDGIGRAFVRNAWDGTSDMSRDDVNQMAAQMESYSKVYKDMPVADAQKMAGDMTDAVDLYRKSKGAAADAVVDGAIIVAGVGGAAFTGGVSLGLIATTGLAGAAFKVGTKAAIEGADYDSSNIASDAATGAIDAATMVVGPGEVAKILKIGGKAATLAGDMAIAEAGNIAKAGGQTLLKEGAEATLSKELTHDVSTALAHGAKEIDAKTMQGLAEKYAARPEDVPAVRELLTRNLNKAIATESGNAMKATLREVALNSGAGAAAGGSSAAVKGFADWDSSKSVSENLTNIAEQTAMGCGMGAAMGGGATVGFKVLGKAAVAGREGFGAAREAIETHLNPLTKVEGAENLAVNKAGQIADIHGPTGEPIAKVKYHTSGPMEGLPSQVRMADGRTFENVGENQIKITSAENPKGVTIDGGVKVNNKGEIELSYGNRDKQTFYPDGTSTLRRDATGDAIAVASDGRMLAVKSNSGHTTEFAYSADGHLQGANYKNGRSISTDDGGKTWNVKETADGQPVKFEGNVTLDRDGVVHMKPADGPERVLRPDGSSSHLDPVTGKPSDITYPNGWSKQIEYAADGSVQKYTSEAGTVYTKAEHGYDLHKADGTDGGFTTAKFSVSPDGMFVEHHGGITSEMHTDGRYEIRNTDSGQVTFERAPDGYAPEGLNRSADGRTLADNQSQRRYIEKNFSGYYSDERGLVVRSVQDELKDVKAVGPDGQPTSAFDSLMKDPSLSDAQKQNVLDNLGMVREHYASYRVGDRMHPDPEVNWIHTQGEMAKVLEVGRAKNLSPTELEDSLLASMYSDSVKFAGPAPDGASANFFTHHLDGALAAEQALTKQGYPAERVARIVEAIKAHQIAPPELMGELYYGQISRTLDKAIADKGLTAEQGAHLKEVLAGMSEKGPDGKTRIKYIADVNNAPRVVNPDGSMEVAFTDEQRQVLSYAGIDKWSTPYDPKFDPNFKQLSAAEKAEALSRNKIAQTLIDGDGIDNYATSGGASKIVAIRGPGTFFKDGQVWDSLKSVDDSFKDGYSVMSPEARSIADANLKVRQTFTDEQVSVVKSEMDDWLRSQGRDPSQPIPYYNTDLKYPTGTKPLPGEKNLPGLTEQETKDYMFAQDIRQKMTDLLRADHRTQGDLPGEFVAKTFRGNKGRNLEFNDKTPDQLEIPGTKPEEIKPGDTYLSPDGSISAYRNAQDNSLLVTDLKNATSLKYDGQNRLLESTAANNNRDFKYDGEGKLNQVSSVNSQTGEKTLLTRNADGEGWTETHTDASGKTTKTVNDKSQVTVDADGTVNQYRKGEWNNEVMDRYNTDGSRDLVKPSGRVEYMTANYGQERNGLENVLAQRLSGDPQHLQRIEGLVNQFEANAASSERHLSENQKALLYKQLNRLLADSPNSAIPMNDRISLAEQILNHSANPASVDQGMNNTCNVTTLEHRNYWRNPDRNAQVIADIADTGKYQFANGQTVNLRDVAGEIKPDYEAQANLNVQRDLSQGLYKNDGARDYSSQLLENAMINSKWANHTETIDVTGRILDTMDVMPRFDGQGKPIGIVNKEHVSKLYDKDGKSVYKFTPGEQYFDDKNVALPAVNPDNVIYDKTGSLVGVVDDMKNMTKVFDAQGRPIDDIHNVWKDGDKVYDANGKLLLMHTKPGDMHYEKVAIGPGDDDERVMVDIDGRQVELKKRDGKPLESPKIYTESLNDISNQVTGFAEKDFVIADKSLNIPSAVGVDSKAELITTLEQMEKDDRLPAVMMVNAAHPQFGHKPSWDEDGNFDTWHVINVQGIEHVKNPQTGADEIMIRYTNQWGSKADHIEHGIDAQTLFDSLKATPKPPTPPPPPPPKPVPPPGQERTTWQKIKRYFGGS